jgi:hypothetical protein
MNTKQNSKVRENTIRIKNSNGCDNVEKGATSSFGRLILLLQSVTSHRSV